MKHLDKIGLIIVFIVWPLSYYLKHINPVDNQMFIDYYITFGYCLGTTLISYYFGKKEQNKIKKILFYYTIAIFHLSIILTYLIDFIADDFFGTRKVIWTLITTAIVNLCIYFFKPKP